MIDLACTSRRPINSRYGSYTYFLCAGPVDVDYRQYVYGQPYCGFVQNESQPIYEKSTNLHARLAELAASRRHASLAGGSWYDRIMIMIMMNFSRWQHILMYDIVYCQIK